MKRLGTKTSAAAMIAIAVVVGVILVMLMNMTTQFTDNMFQMQSKSANDAFIHIIDNYQSEALERAVMIAGSSDVVDAVKNGDSEKLMSALKNLSTGLDLITLCDAEGTVLARTHSDKTGDSVLSQAAISTALKTGTGIKTIEPGTVIGFSTRGSAAIKDKDGTIIGALTCGHDLSQSKYVDFVKEQNNCEATIFVNDERMSTTLMDEKGERAVGTKASDSIAQLVLTDNQTHNGRADLFGKTYSVCYSPLIVNGNVMGMLFTGVVLDAALSQQREMIVMIIIAAAMLLLAILLTLILIYSATKRAYWYESMLDSIPFPISVTDMNMKWTFVNSPVEQMLGKKRTELNGSHCSNWGAGICNTDNCGISCLKKDNHITYFDQADCHFQVNVNYLHDARNKKIGHIEIVQDITKMVESQKAQERLVEQIREVSSAFVSASRQIADGSQSLAQGSTQQSASVEQLSTTISGVAQKTRDNADMAVRAAELANTIKNNAEKGSRQMDEMMSAVKDINAASQSIGKVIKVIDDIAFQTNILALNAAVEAARAGQHGKGFAVVAEEVRNLAAKSAAAAKDTSALIADSIEKAELGSSIAGDTALSLSEIVNGINESSKLVGDIAMSSNEQSVSIAQINKGIEQVAEVVHATSATAQQSASAADELKETSDVLESLLSNTGNSGNIPALPSSGR